MKLSVKHFGLQWVTACTAGELLGISSAATIARLQWLVLGEPHTLSQKVAVLAAMLVAGAIEGGLLGYFQWMVLSKALPALKAREWVGATLAVAVTGWLIGMLPSLFITDTGNAAPMTEPSPALFALLVVAMGLSVGACFGFAQWLVLKKYVSRSARWIVANALGWGFGLGWIYLAASLPDETTPVGTVITLGVAGGLLAGLTFGTVTAYFIQQLLRKQLFIMQRGRTAKRKIIPSSVRSVDLKVRPDHVH